MTIKKDGEKWLADVRPQGVHGKRYRRKFNTKFEAVQYKKHLFGHSSQ